MSNLTYPIGTPGQPWGASEIAQWRSQHPVQRRYTQDVLSVIERLKTQWQVKNYAHLHAGEQHFHLNALVSPHWDEQLPSVLVTGGVHGYETSGVLGALHFAEIDYPFYVGRVNLVVVPCVSPWAYERIQRWNYDAIDPNRSFVQASPATEAAALMALIAELNDPFCLHIDLHETTDTDETEFSPAKAARDGVEFVPCPIPDGFYLVANAQQPELAFQTAIIEAVSQITAIAQPDENGCLDGEPMIAPGILSLETTGVCTSVTQAQFTTTTEVYPDSRMTTPEECIRAQSKAVCAALDYVLAQL